VKVGDLVKCLFQPGSSGYDDKTTSMIPMSYNIKGELGIYIKHRDECSGAVLFPQFGYVHTIAWSALEVVNESR
jgi:hypothetical protein